MGRRGPVGKRSDAVMGHRTKAELAQRAVEKAPGAETVDVPPARQEWHPIARDWYESLALSGQRRFYEPSDWSVAQFVAENMSRHLHGDRLSANMVTAVLKGCDELLSSEAARRRLRLELQRGGVENVEAPGVTAIDEYKRRLQA